MPMDRRLIDDARDAVLRTTHRIQMTLPSVVAVGERFSLRLTVFGADDMPTEAFTPELVFGESPNIAGLPRSARFDPNGAGGLTIDGLTVERPGVAYVSATPPGSPTPVVSNPCRAFDDPPYRVFWGDLHIHTTYSNCSPWACKHPEFAYAYARDATHLDFAAAADHLRGIASESHRWGDLQDLARRYTEPGRFVVFPGFESSHRTGFGGDNNAYYLGDNGGYFWLDREDMKKASPEVPLERLWEFLAEQGGPFMTVPHHTGRAGKYRRFDDDVYNPDYEPLFEIFSFWGSSERRFTRFPLHAGNTDQPAYFRDALLSGRRYGVIASSDDHLTLPGGESQSRSAFGPNRQSGYIHRGLAAVCAAKLDRESLWSAMQARRCYGTTFVRALLDVRIGELAMGRAGHITRGDPLREHRRIAVEFYSTDPVPVTMTLVRNGDDIARKPWDPASPALTFEDPTPLDEIAIRDARFARSPFVVYYVRAEGAYDETQWSSPIWLDL